MKQHAAPEGPVLPLCSWRTAVAHEREPTSVESFAVGEEGELEEQSAQQVCSPHHAGHLVGMEERENERGDTKEGGGGDNYLH